MTDGARLDAPADPAAAFSARPEWYFMALNQLNTLFGPIGGALLPPLVILFLMAVPFIDRGRSGRPPLLVLGPAVLFGVSLLALTANGLIEDAGDADLQKQLATARAEGDAALQAFQSEGVDGLGRIPSLAALKIYREQGCAGCHDDAEVPAPRLSGWGTIERTAAFLEDPDAPRFFHGTPFEGEMPGMSGPAETREALAAYLIADSGLGLEVPASTLAAGKAAFEDEACATCHNPPELSPRDRAFDFRTDGPSLRGYAGHEWTRGVIIDPNHPSFFGGSVSDPTAEGLMPPYPDLDPDSLDLLVRWLTRGAPGAL